MKKIFQHIKRAVQETKAEMIEKKIKFRDFYSVKAMLFLPFALFLFYLCDTNMPIIVPLLIGAQLLSVILLLAIPYELMSRLLSDEPVCSCCGQKKVKCK